MIRIAGPILMLVTWPTAVAQERPVFKTATDAVAVDVSVRAGRRPITGLTIRDFDLFDGGRRQEILDVSVETMPLEIVLLLDDSASLDAASVARIRSTPIELQRVLHPQDRLDTLGFAGRPARLAGPLPESLPGSSPERDQTSLFDAIVAAVIQQPDPTRRRLLIVVSDGIEATSVVGYDLRSAVLDRSDAVIDLVLVTEWRWPGQYWLPADVFWRAPRERAELFRASESGIPWVLYDIAERTGGRLFEVKPRDDFLPALMESVSSFRDRYVLRYIPTGVPLSGWHDLKVTVPARRYEVRHRRGYWRPSSR